MSIALALSALLMGASALNMTSDAGVEINSTASYLRGIDVSHYQGTIDWTKVKGAGFTFACTKATEGTTYVDPSFATNWKQMNAVGLYRCAYHFFHPASDPTTQAKFFVNTVNSAGGFHASNTLQFMLDLETTDNLSPAAVWSSVQTFLGEIQTLTGRPGIIYTGYYFWKDNVGNPTNNLNCPLWIASYTSPAPAGIPAAWTYWTFWQYDDNGASSPGGPAASIPGIAGNVDVDYFAFDLATLAKFVIP